MNDPTELRLAMLANGFQPVPIRTGKKYPTVDDWPQIAATATPDRVRRWPDAIGDHGGTGVLCGAIIGLDIDVLDPSLCDDLEFLARDMLGDTPLRRVGRAPKTLLVYQSADAQMRKLQTPALALDGVAAKVEALAAGEQFVAFGIHPDTGQPYTWGDQTPATCDALALPDVTEAQLRQFLTAAEAMLRQAGYTGRKRAAAAASRASGQRSAGDLAPPSAQRVVDLLNRMPNTDDVDYDRYTRVMLGAVGCVQGLGDECSAEDAAAIRDAACDWANRTTKPQAHDPREKWDRDWSKRTAPLAGWRTLQDEAKQLLPETRQEFAVDDFEGADMPPGDPDAWRDLLKRGEPTKSNPDGPIKGTLVNAIIALTCAPDWQGRLSFCEFRDRALIDGVPLRESDPIRCAEWLQLAGINVSSALAMEALTVVCERHRSHPVREYLDGLAWDGTPRIDTWLIDHLGAVDSPFVRAAGSKFLMAMVARIRDPGCQVDTVLVLEGTQGRKKSSALRVLANGWFTDHLPELTNKDALLQLQGVWLVEVAEMDKMHRAEVGRVKSFISTRIDRFRRPYGRVTEDVPRQSVIVATINPGADGYLQDETGARRFWPVEVAAEWAPGRTVDIRALTAARNQLWAEAQHRYAAGEEWYLHTLDLEQEQARAADLRYATDDWEDRIGGYVAGLPEVQIGDILSGCLSLPAKDWDERKSKRVGRVLRHLGWERSRARRDGRLVYLFLPPGATADVLSIASVA